MIGSEGLKALAQGLLLGGSLVHLNLSGNMINGTGAENFFKAVGNSLTLTSLDLGNLKGQKNHNKLGLSGCQGLAQALESNPLLQILNLRDNAL